MVHDDHIHREQNAVSTRVTFFFCGVLRVVQAQKAKQEEKHHLNRYFHVASYVVNRNHYQEITRDVGI